MCGRMVLSIPSDDGGATSEYSLKEKGIFSFSIRKVSMLLFCVHKFIYSCTVRVLSPFAGSLITMLTMSPGLRPGPGSKGKVFWQSFSHGKARSWGLGWRANCCQLWQKLFSEMLKASELPVSKGTPSHWEPLDSYYLISITNQTLAAA